MKKERLRAVWLALLLVLIVALGVWGYPKLAGQVARESVDGAATAQPQATQELAVTAKPLQTEEPEGTIAPQTQKPEVTPSPEADAAQGEVFGPVAKNFARDFTIYAEDGEALRLSELRGMPVVVNFFASWCGPCRSEMGHFEEAVKAYEGRVRFLMVDVSGMGNDTPEDALTMVEELGCTFPIYFDADAEAMIAHGIRAFPTTLFVTSDGELLGTQVGAMTQDMLSQAVETLLAAEDEGGQT